MTKRRRLLLKLQRCIVDLLEVRPTPASRRWLADLVRRLLLMVQMYFDPTRTGRYKLARVVRSPTLDEAYLYTVRVARAAIDVRLFRRSSRSPQRRKIGEVVVVDLESESWRQSLNDENTRAGDAKQRRIDEHRVSRPVMQPNAVRLAANSRTGANLCTRLSHRLVPRRVRRHRCLLQQREAHPVAMR